MEGFLFSTQKFLNLLKARVLLEREPSKILQKKTIISFGTMGFGNAWILREINYIFKNLETKSVLD